MYPVDIKWKPIYIVKNVLVKFSTNFEMLGKGQKQTNTHTNEKHQIFIGIIIFGGSKVENNQANTPTCQ